MTFCQGRAPDVEQDLEQNVVSSTGSIVAELQQLTGVASVVPSEGPDTLELQAFNGGNWEENARLVEVWKPYLYMPR